MAVNLDKATSKKGDCKFAVYAGHLLGFHPNTRMADNARGFASGGGEDPSAGLATKKRIY